MANGSEVLHLRARKMVRGGHAERARGGFWGTRALSVLQRREARVGAYCKGSEGSQGFVWRHLGPRARRAAPTVPKTTTSQEVIFASLFDCLRGKVCCTAVDSSPDSLCLWKCLFLDVICQTRIYLCIYFTQKVIIIIILVIFFFKLSVWML